MKRKTDQTETRTEAEADPDVIHVRVPLRQFSADAVRARMARHPTYWL